MLPLSVFNSVQLYSYLSAGEFSDEIEWLKFFFLDLYSYSILWMPTISRFWMCSGWEFIIFDERNIFLGPQGPTGTILVQVEIELVPRFGGTLIRKQRKDQ